MKEKIMPLVENSTNLGQIREKMISLFDSMKGEYNNVRIGYVSGIISSDGPEHIATNLKKLETVAQEIRNAVDFDIFGSPDIFSTRVYSQLQELALPHEERENAFNQFWREILESGHVTDIFMTPRWEHSKGAVSEYTIAQEQNIRIHYVENGELGFMFRD